MSGSRSLASGSFRPFSLIPHPFPAPLSPQTPSLRSRNRPLASALAKGAKSNFLAIKGVGWTSEAIGTPDVALISAGLISAAENAVEEVDPQWELKSLVVPGNPQFTPPGNVQRSQLGLGGMAVNPKPGDTCHLPPPPPPPP